MLKNVENKGIEVTSQVEMPTTIQVDKTKVVDNLTSTATDEALSANMGRVLNEKIVANDNDITTINNELSTINGKVTENTQDIALLGNKSQENADAIDMLDTRTTANEDAISANAASITSNSDNITLLDQRLQTTESDVTDNANNIASLTTRVTENEKQIKDSQLKDLIVNVEETFQGVYRADHTSGEIRNAVNQGRDAYIKFNDLIYDFVEMNVQGYAKFRWIDVQSEKLGKRELNVDYAGNVEKVDLLYNGVTKSQIENGDVQPIGGYLRTLYETAGAKWLAPNKWELNGIPLNDKEINDHFMQTITFNNFEKQQNFYGRFSNISIKTNFANAKLDYRFIRGNCRELFAFNYTLINVVISNNEKASTFVNALAMFSQDRLLRKIIGKIDLNYCEDNKFMFEGCKKLEEVYIENLGKDLSFADSPLISKQSILTIIENHKATSPIVVTLHPQAYARLANDSDILAAIQAYPNIGLAQA